MLIVNSSNGFVFRSSVINLINSKQHYFSCTSCAQVEHLCQSMGKLLALPQTLAQPEINCQGQKFYTFSAAMWK